MRPAYLVACVACVLLLLVVLILRPTREAPPTTDWEMAAVCVWERWSNDQPFELQGRILRFCVTVEPHSLPPSAPTR